MTYQVRITDPDGSNPVILEKADNVSYNKVVNTTTESLSFELPTSDGKSSLVTYANLWEFWDVFANERLNRGPIHSIEDTDSGTLRISGPGRSQFLADHIQENLISFYSRPSDLISGLRYENVAANPAAKTYVWDAQTSTKTMFFPTDVTVNTEKYNQYYGLSKQTKDNAIDNNIGYIKPGADKPVNTYTTTDSYWSGTDVVDSLIIDLGSTFLINHASIVFAWWGGNQRVYDRGYKFRFYHSTDTGDFETVNPSNWVLMYEDTEGRNTGSPGSGYNIVYGTGTNAGRTVYTGTQPTSIRYFRVVITGTTAWYGSIYDASPPEDKWDFQCNPDTTQTNIGPSGALQVPPMQGKKINDRTLEPPNDCHASIVEFLAYTELVEVNQITKLIKQRIKNDNKQIKYFHTCSAGDTITSGSYRKFEPGGFFEQVELSYTGASSSYTKFFDSDCTNCYSSFNFGIVDDYNSLIYASSSSSGSNINLTIPRNARSLTMKGSTTAVINNVDVWPTVLDPLSWGGQYSYTETAGDYLYLNFRGRSFQWWGTVPAGKTAGVALVKLRSRNDATGDWNAWTTLESGLNIPVDISSEIIYEIDYDSGILADDTSYQVYIENLNGGYISLDSFGGWWEGSILDLNDDSDRIFIAHPDNWKQIYDNRFSNGTMGKTNLNRGRGSLGFTGDRLQIYSAKGRNHGKISISMSSSPTGTLNQWDPTGEQRVFIPGGDPSSGTLTIDLDTGKKGNEAPNVLIFDTDSLTGWKYGPSGTPVDSLRWKGYQVSFELFYYEKYYTDALQEDTDQFVARCSDCNPPTTGTDYINKYIYLDGMSLHEVARMSGSWKLQTNIAIIASIAEALQLEWDIGEQGLTVLPRIGTDTDIILKEGINTVISSQVVKDGQKMATQLYSSGADIDGLPLFSIVEDRKNREVLGRTVQRLQDYRDLADYFTLIGVSRAELVRRREPEYRIDVTHVGYKYGLNAGDSFIVKKNAQDPIRARINSLIINQSKSSGITYSLECVKWPPIV